MRIGVIAAAMAAVFMIAGCGGDEGGPVDAGSSPKKIADTYIGEMEKVADALDGIESDADVEAAAKVIQGASQTLNSMSEALDGEISGMKAMRIFGARSGDFIQVQQRIASSMSALAMKDPEMLQRISEEMEKLPTGQ